MNITATDIKEKMVFTRIGYEYRCIYYNDVFHCGVWRMTRQDGSLVGYEVVRCYRYRNPDGSIIYRYPGDEDFGVSGFYDRNLGRLMVHLDRWMELE